MKLYMIRHGESVANLHRLHAGWSETPLSPKGEAEASNTGKILKDYSFDKVYSSDLVRAMQTKELALPGTEVSLTEMLREINVGELAGKTAQECLLQYGERYTTDKANHDFRFYGGENRKTHQKRVSSFLDSVTLDNLENVVAFCHEGTIRCAMRIVGFSEADKITLKNGGVYIFEYLNDSWTYISELNI